MCHSHIKKSKNIGLQKNIYTNNLSLCVGRIDLLTSKMCEYLYEFSISEFANFNSRNRVLFLATGNVKVVPVLNQTPRHEDVLREWRYSSTHAWPRHLMEVSCQIHDPAALPPGKEPLVPIGYEAGWAREPFWTRWWREKFPAPTGNLTLEPRSSSP
jgi:hypothetical protein